MKTIQEAAQAALDCQDACNLSGVVFSFAKAMQIICDEANAKGYGTAWKNEHPIVLLFVDKLGSLCHVQDAITHSRAYDSCKRLAEGV